MTALLERGTADRYTHPVHFADRCNQQFASIIIEYESVDGQTGIMNRKPPGAGHDPAAPGRLPDWETLYRDLGERVFRLVHRMTGDADLAADLTHDTFVRVYERASQYDGRGAARSWVFQIAVNLVRERGRSASRRAALLERESPTFAGSSRSDAARVELRIALDEALSKLPARQRVALLLYDVDGYSHADIAAMLGMAEGSSKARVSRARAAMRAMLDGRI